MSDYTHPIDRVARKFRGLIIVLAVVSFPVFLVSYIWMVREAFFALPLWAWLGLVVSHTIGFLGIASLFDRYQERRNDRE